MTKGGTNNSMLARLKSAYQRIVPEPVKDLIYQWRHPEYRFRMRLSKIGRPAIRQFMTSLASNGVLAGNVLEIGAGRVQLNQELFSSKVKNYWRTDMSYYPGIEVDLLCDCTCLPFPSHSLDAVICSEVLEHVPPLEPALAELARILRPGGHLVLTMPFFYPLHGVNEKEQGDYWRLTPGNLKLLLGGHFELVQEHRAHLFRPGDDFVVSVQMLWRRKGTPAAAKQESRGAASPTQGAGNAN